MISTTQNLTGSAALSVAFPAARRTQDTTATNSDFASSFATQLASMLQGYLGGNSASSHLEFSIDAQPGQETGTRQFVVTLKNNSPAPASVTAAPAPAAVAPAAVRVTPTIPASPAPAAPTPAFKDEVDAYWAGQPTEVQALRTIPDLAGRNAKAAELMAKGFTIDADIMVWGWDPYAVMKNRMDAGYAWVPSAGQPNIPLGPGLSFPGLPAYDPLHPPAGSILVSLDFAKGLEHTSSAWHDGSPS
ncbi:MAG: hypothetical protein RL328_541 [Acidobacteriota bacterium]|jgi:hypothetical protein